MYHLASVPEAVLSLVLPGGVTEAVLRRLQQGTQQVDMEAIKKSGVRGDEGIKTFDI